MLVCERHDAIGEFIPLALKYISLELKYYAPSNVEYSKSRTEASAIQTTAVDARDAATAEKYTAMMLHHYHIVRFFVHVRHHMQVHRYPEKTPGREPTWETNFKVQKNKTDIQPLERKHLQNPTRNHATTRSWSRTSSHGVAKSPHSQYVTVSMPQSNQPAYLQGVQQNHPSRSASPSAPYQVQQKYPFRKPKHPVSESRRPRYEVHYSKLFFLKPLSSQEPIYVTHLARSLSTYKARQSSEPTPGTYLGLHNSTFKL